MNKLVFLESDNMKEEPFTTDEIIAEYSGNSRSSVTRLIRVHKKRLEEFGTLGFEIRPSGRARKKIYRLNREQATLLIVFLDNSPKVINFKVELVQQFYSMEAELVARRMERKKSKKVRLSMTDAIKSQGLSPHFYKHYTNLCYKSAIGFNATQIKNARNVDKKYSLMDYLSIEELEAVNERESQIATMITLGMSYDQIKAVLKNNGVIYQTTLKTPMSEKEAV